VLESNHGVVPEFFWDFMGKFWTFSSLRRILMMKTDEFDKQQEHLVNPITTF